MNNEDRLLHNKNKLMVHMYIVTNITIFLIVRLWRYTYVPLTCSCYSTTQRGWRTSRTLTSYSYTGPILRRNVLPLPASKLHGVTSRRIHYTVTAVSQSIYLTVHFTQEKIRKNGASFCSPDISVVRPHARHSTFATSYCFNELYFIGLCYTRHIFWLNPHSHKLKHKN